MDIKIALENNFKVLKEPLLKMAIDRIEELEKENKKLKKRCDKYEETISKMEKGTCDICKETAKDRELVELKEQIENLEGIKLSQGSALETEYMINESLKEENAELKKGLSVVNASNSFNKEQLTKAKEIIRELLNSCFGYNSKTVNYEVKVKAEQFLNSEV